MVFVTMTDSFMSGWGKSKNKINKLVFECKDYEQAEIVKENALNRPEQKYINICLKRPNYDSNKYLVDTMTIDNSPNWYKPGFFTHK